MASSGAVPTLLATTSGARASGGERLLAVHRDTGAGCFQASLPLAPFDQSSPSISPDGTVFVGAAEAVVAARFDGLAWAATVTPRPGSVYRAPTALLGPVAAGQPVLLATSTGALEELVFPPAPADPQGLPGAPSQAFASAASSGPGYAAGGATVAADGTITVGTEDGHVVAFDLKGGLRWSAPLAGKATAPPTHGADGTLYAVDETGRLTALNVADGKVRWTFQAAAALRVPPALGCDGTLYLGSDDGTVYALVSDSPGLADSPWPRAGRDNRGTGDMRRPLRDASGTCLE
jgi:outer membrane protein assembly factor BamB